MSQLSGLRRRIEKIGQDILDNYCQKTGPIMIPPIPDSKFIDKLPEDMILQGQDGYVAEVKVFRYLEDVKKNVIALHQLEYTHEQYSAFLPSHQCNKKDCKKEPKIHPCHQQKRNVEGETDFLVLGDRFALVLEVKGALAAVQIQGCCEDGLRQRQRVVNLIKSVNPSLPVYEFTVFSNVSGDEVDEEFLIDTTLMFSDDLQYLEQILDCCETYASIISRSADFQTPDVKRCMLGLWCINQDNKWDIGDCSLSNCIKGVDEKLRRSLDTRRSIDQAEQETSSKGKKRMTKDYPENPNITNVTPDIFKEHLNVRCLTEDQLKLFCCKDRFLWVDGPAGSGKTIAMLGKIIDIALNEAPHERILIILQGGENTPAPNRHLELLNGIRKDITCAEIVYDHMKWDGDISERLDRAHDSLSRQLKDSSANIVLLKFGTYLINSIDSVITRYFNHIFVDDFQQLFDMTVFDIYENPSRAPKNIVSEGLLPIVKNSSTNNSTLCMWVLCDHAQGGYDWIIKLSSRLSLLTDAMDELRKHFVNSKQLTVNLRNTYEISSTLSIIRQHNQDKMDFASTLPETWPQQRVGHFLRGTKPVFHILQTSKTSEWRKILSQEIEILKGLGSCLKNSNIAVIVGTANNDNFRETWDNTLSVVEKWNAEDEKIKVCIAANSVSAEWACVVVIWRYGSVSTTITLPDNSVREIRFSDTIPILYLLLSRARVHCSVILLDYQPYKCQYTDGLLKELRSRSDICRMIER